MYYESPKGYQKSIYNYKISMFKRILILALLAIAAYSYMESPDQFLARGFDIRDGILEEFPNYNVQIDTKCNSVKLGAPYNYNGTVMSGYLKIGKGNSVLSFIFYGKENVEMSKINTIPTVLWLNGGPGSSSQLGNFLELGPFWLKTSSKFAYQVIRNNNSWTKDYNVIFVDQPVGTGLSYADPTVSNVYVTNQTDLANDFYKALNQLYNNPNGCFQRLNIRGSDPLFIFGQSYAGKYAPAIGQKILREAKNKNGFLTGLKGIAIGDGFTNPGSTLSMMGQYAYNFGLIDYQQRAKAQQYILNATYQEMNYRWRDLHESFYKVLNLITSTTGGVNVYDITKYKPYPTSLIGQYLNDPSIISLYGLDPSIKFDSQYSNVRQALFEDFMKNEASLVQVLLIQHNIPVLVYTGQNDLIVQTPGTLKWVERLHYGQRDEFRNTLLTPWKLNNKVVGFYKKVGNLWLITINDAGHLIPMDQGQVALAMLNDFVKSSLKSENIPKQNVNISDN